MQELHESLKKVVAIAKSYGYHCYQTDWKHIGNSGKCKYIHISNEDKSIVGSVHVRENYHTAVERSTCHMPSREWGSGISIDYYEGLEPDNITKEWLDQIFSTSSFGIRVKGGKPVPKKLSVEEYIKAHHLGDTFIEL